MYHGSALEKFGGKIRNAFEEYKIRTYSVDVYIINSPVFGISR